jgi:hypothetical protein
MMRVQDGSALLAEGPVELLERPIQEYRPLLRDRDLQPAVLEAVDYAVRHSVIRLLVRQADDAELEAANDAIRRLVPVSREEELSTWVIRWRAFADLLEGRLAARANQRPAEARKLAHAEEILDLLAERPDLSQADIARELKLKEANLSRILAVLEAHDLITRRVVGREKQARLAPAFHRAGLDIPLPEWNFPFRDAGSFLD